MATQSRGSGKFIGIMSDESNYLTRPAYGGSCRGRKFISLLYLHIMPAEDNGVDMDSRRVTVTTRVIVAQDQRHRHPWSSLFAARRARTAIDGSGGLEWINNHVHGLVHLLRTLQRRLAPTGEKKIYLLKGPQWVRGVRKTKTVG